MASEAATTAVEAAQQTSSGRRRGLYPAQSMRRMFRSISTLHAGLLRQLTTRCG